MFDIVENTAMPRDVVMFVQDGKPVGIIKNIAPDIQFPAPSAPGSASSERAARKVTKDPMRRKAHELIMLTLAGKEKPISRAELVQLTGLTINVVCPRVDELRPMWIEQVPDACYSLSDPTLKVDGLRLTEAGLKRVREGK